MVRCEYFYSIILCCIRRDNYIIRGLTFHPGLFVCRLNRITQKTYGCMFVKYFENACLGPIRQHMVMIRVWIPAWRMYTFYRVSSRLFLCKWDVKAKCANLAWSDLVFCWCAVRLDSNNDWNYWHGDLELNPVMTNNMKNLCALIVKWICWIPEMEMVTFGFRSGLCMDFPLPFEWICNNLACYGR